MNWVKCIAIHDRKLNEFICKLLVDIAMLFT